MGAKNWQQSYIFNSLTIFTHVTEIDSSMLLPYWTFATHKKKLSEQNSFKDAISIFFQSLLIHSSGVVISSESITQTTSWLLSTVLYKPIFFLSCESLLSCSSWNWITFLNFTRGKNFGSSINLHDKCDTRTIFFEFCCKNLGNINSSNLNIREIGQYTLITKCHSTR